MNKQYFKYDVGLSFAGERREYVEEVANRLKSRGVTVFYDDYERETLWGKDLYSHLSEVYQHMCRYCVIFVSEEYASKVWPNRERESAQARALEEKQEYILPARFDDTPIPGLLETVGYVNLTDMSPQELCDLIVKKIGKQIREHYLPPNLDRLFHHLDIEDHQEFQEEVYSHAYSFFDALQRMTSEERDAVIGLIRFGCPSYLPENVHIHCDLLRRRTGMSVARLKRLLSGVNSLGFRCSVAKDAEHDVNLPGTTIGDRDLFYLRWLNLTGEEKEFPEMLVAREMIVGATEHYCEHHGTLFLERLDFSQLASVTASSESNISDE